MNKILKRILYGLLAVIVLCNLLILITGKTYFYTTLIHLWPDLDDYKIFENREIPAYKPQPWHLSQRYNKKPLPESLSKELKDLKTTAFLVIKNDSIVYEQYDDGGGKETISNSFSVAKSVVNILTGIAYRDGYIKSLDEPVGDFLPEFNTGKKAKITIRNLLTMSSGLQWDEEYSNPFSPTTEAYYGNDLADLVLKAPVINEPGKLWSYKTTDPQILSMVLHKATGQTMSDYAAQKLWSVIGAEKPALWSLDHKNGDEKAYCCFNAIARDFARIGKLYLQHGRWNDVQVVPAAFADLSTQPCLINDDDGNPVDYYGYLWWCMKYRNHEVFYARGIKGQYVIVVPESKTIIVRLGINRSSHKVNHTHQEVVDMIAAALDM